MTIAELVAKIGFKMDEGSLEKANGALEGLVHAAKAVTTAFVGQEIFKGMREIATRAMEDAHAVEKLSERFGVSAEKLQELGVAAGDMGIEGVGHAMRFLSRNAYEASQNGGEVAETFRKLGVTSLRDTNGQMKTADVLMADVAEGMSKIKDPVQRVAMATKLFGREGANMVNMLSKGKKGLEEAALRAHKFGFVMSESFIKKGHDMHESQRDMDMAFTGLSRSIADKLMPAFTWLYEKIAAGVSWFTEMANKSSLVQTVLVVLAGVMATLALWTLVAMAPWLIWAVAIGLVVLALDDFAAWIRGGKSLFGEFFGDLTKDIDGTTEAMRTLVDLFRAFRGVMKGAKELFRHGDVMAAWDTAMDVAGGGSGSNGLDDYRKGQQTLDDFLDKTHKQYARPSSAVASYAGSAQQIPLAPITTTVNVYGTPGMDTTELGDKAADAMGDVLRQHHIEQAHAALGLDIPLAAIP